MEPIYIAAIASFLVGLFGYIIVDDLVKSHEFNYRWLSRLRIATPCQG